MGGGDLNSKKSWHPNTIKNQERVWKAEQAAAEERKRILELQRERAEERDRAELNEMAKQSTGTNSDGRLNWMYDKPDKKAKDEDYLLGKTIEKNYGNSEKKEQNVIPAVARRVVGSSMLTSSEESQVDLARKIREDPLLLVKERERAARAALLNNPLQRRRLTELLRKDQEQKKEKAKKKSKTKGNLDDKLAAKLNALSGGKGLDIAKLLESDNTSSESDSEETKKKKKKKKEKKAKNKSKKSEKKKSKLTSDTEESSSTEESKHRKKKYRDKVDNESHSHESKKRKSEVDPGYNPKRQRESSHTHRERKESPQRDYTKNRHKSSDDDDTERRGPALDSRKKPVLERPRKGLSEEERAAKLAEMARAGAQREVERGRRVADQRRAAAAPAPAHPRAARPEARALPDSLESRIHSNRHYIQRDRHHMNEHFARR